MEKIIEVKGLEHSYDDFKAVKGISFYVKKGEIFSFLGPNGAGKSTTINILTTLLPIQSGRVTITGLNLEHDRLKVRQNIGIVFQDEVLDRDLTVQETLEFHGKLYSMPKEKRKKRIEEMLELVELTEKRNERVRYLSGGMRRRLEISRGLMTRPQVLFLDEPTIGLDPQTRLRIWEYMRKVNDEGTTIFLTTHYMDEADSLADRIFIMDHGEIIASGTGDELKATLGQDLVYLQTRDNKKSTAVLEDWDGLNYIKQRNDVMEISLNTDGTRTLPKIISALMKSNITIESINMKKPTLDDVFVHYTGRELKDDTSHKKPAKRRRRR